MASMAEECRLSEGNPNITYMWAIVGINNKSITLSQLIGAGINGRFRFECVHYVIYWYPSEPIQQFPCTWEKNIPFFITWTISFFMKQLTADIGFYQKQISFVTFSPFIEMSITLSKAWNIFNLIIEMQPLCNRNLYIYSEVWVNWSQPLHDLVCQQHGNSIASVYCAYRIEHLYYRDTNWAAMKSSDFCEAQGMTNNRYQSHTQALSPHAFPSK